jgi:rod shape-determining protein MreB
VLLADNPLTCVARGGGKIIEILDKQGTDFFELN